MGVDSVGSAGPLVRYRNRDVWEQDLAFLRAVVARGWRSRNDLARAVCSAWMWQQPNGSPSLYACLDLLRKLEESGYLKLPAPHPNGKRPLGEARRRQLPLLPVDLIPLIGLEVSDPEADLARVRIRPIAPEERQGWRVYMARYHYLGDRPIVGEHLLYAAFLDDELVALLGWASAALRAPLRDEYIGWNEATKRRRLHLVANNIRFLILPWIRVRHLASKVLALNLQRLSTDWVHCWKHPLHLAETFVDTARFRGTCYRASNWIYLGQTAGRTKRGNAYLQTGTPKALFIYPLGRQCCRRLRGEPVH